MCSYGIAQQWKQLDPHQKKQVDGVAAGCKTNSKKTYVGGKRVTMHVTTVVRSVLAIYLIIASH